MQPRPYRTCVRCVILQLRFKVQQRASPLSLSNSTDTPAASCAGGAVASGAAADSSTMRRLRVRLLPLP